MPIVIYHNPNCSKSRRTLAMLEEKGLALEVVLYLETPPSADTLKEIFTKLGMSAGEIIRKNETVYEDLQLDGADVTDDMLIAAMVEHPILIERPIVVNGEKAAIGRPPENALEIL